jgi:hypothetical protein
VLERSQFWLLTAISATAALLVAVNAVLVRGNLATQADISARAQYIQQSLQLEGLYRDIVRALAELSARSNDNDLRALLQAHGITFTLNPPAPAGSAPPGSTPASSATAPAPGNAPGRK